MNMRTQPNDLCKVLGADAAFSAAVWNAMTSDPFLGVQLVRADGLILYANDQAAEMVICPGKTGAQCTGRNASEFASRKYVDERLAGLLTIPSDGTPHVARSIIEGRQMISTVRVVPAPKPLAAGQRVYLILTRHVEGPARRAMKGEHDSQIFEPKTVRLGPLAILSGRELEVLAMIGDGYSTPEIAQRMFRSINTINDHRKNIAKKLGVKRAARLAEVARRAGLTREDAQKDRT